MSCYKAIKLDYYDSAALKPGKVINPKWVKSRFGFIAKTIKRVVSVKGLGE